MSLVNVVDLKGFDLRDCVEAGAEVSIDNEGGEGRFEISDGATADNAIRHVEQVTVYRLRVEVIECD
jgi:hypothetical protein